jgi:hypothetical protein
VAEDTLTSRKELSSFIKHCKEHPDERFWQAIRNWSGYSAIYAEGITGLIDTFSWGRRRNDGD